MMIVEAPWPQPTSATFDPRGTSSERNGTRLWYESPSIMMLRKRSNFATSTSFQNDPASAYSKVYVTPALHDFRVNTGV